MGSNLAKDSISCYFGLRHMDSVTEFLQNSLSATSFGVSQAIVAILLAYLGGIVSSLTPCVYPMIPITVSVVGGLQGARRSWAEVGIKAVAYILGMALVYSAL